MRPIWQRLSLSLILITLMTTAAFGADLKDLDWLAGDWVLTKGTRTIEEQWMRPSGGMMLGASRTVNGGKVNEFEFLRIEQRGDDLFYVAQPGGRPPTEFKLVNNTANEVVFENLQNDFPKQISYTRNEDGSVTARIMGPGKDAKGVKVIAFEYKRPK
jgi:hypothetical protein